MSGLARYACAIDGIVAEMELGRRRPIDTVTPDGDECEHMAALLRRGVTVGIGILSWDLRTPLGTKPDAELLEIAAGAVEEGALSGVDPDWRIIVRR